jgi:hypothetical protein
VHAITEAALLGHLNVLAADGLRGRRAGSDYERQAAEYIRGEFMEYGLELGALDYFQSFPITRAVDGQTGLISQNVLGVLPGQGALATQWVIVGGHYDHLGWQNDGGSVVVYNGADDNASGTAAVMEVARYLSQYTGLRRRGGRTHRLLLLLQSTDGPDGQHRGHGEPRHDRPPARQSADPYRNFIVRRLGRPGRQRQPRRLLPDTVR